ncbi:hypothetical protein H5410_028110 [Solanum commersonii]|uniref:Uncharacterized protein n=1 Tax=Solanum commersonii TaxID=4109 RepID=A0A9J5Z1R0_SOLCO|nr:hypothetical protein H5410_028110 [Solanum commersonii]
MYIQAQPKCSNALTQRMIPYSHNGSPFKALESDATVTLTKKNRMHNFTHRFARIFQSTFVSAHSRSKRFHRRLALSCSIIVFESLGDIVQLYRTAQR